MGVSERAAVSSSCTPVMATMRRNRKELLRVEEDLRRYVRIVRQLETQLAQVLVARA